MTTLGWGDRPLWPWPEVGCPSPEWHLRQHSQPCGPTFISGSWQPVPRLQFCAWAAVPDVLLFAWNQLLLLLTPPLTLPPPSSAVT